MGFLDTLKEFGGPVAGAIGGIRDALPGEGGTGSGGGFDVSRGPASVPLLFVQSAIEGAREAAIADEQRRAELAAQLAAIEGGGNTGPGPREIGSVFGQPGGAIGPPLPPVRPAPVQAGVGGGGGGLLLLGLGAVALLALTGRRR